MIILNCSILLLASVLISDVKAAQNKNIFCVHCGNSITRYEEGIFEANDIEGELCTHLIYYYVEIEYDGTIRLYDQENVFDKKREANVKQFNRKKHYYPHLKTLALVGPSESAVNGFLAELFKTDDNQEIFVKSAVDFLIKYNFDGMVLHWTYPGVNFTDPERDKFTLITLLKKLKKELTKRDQLLIIYCHAFAPIVAKSYSVKEIAENVDYIYLQAHNYYGRWSIHTGIAGALYSRSDALDKTLNADSGIKSWLDLGAPSNKIIMGIAFSGRTFTLKYANQTELGSPVVGLGLPSKYTPVDGIITYLEICQRLSDEKWTVVWDDIIKNPYAVKGDQWIGFENKKSIEAKANYVVEQNISGIALTCMEDDDFRGMCGAKYPLLNVLNKYLRSDDDNFQYVVQIYLFKRNLNDQSTQVVYHGSEILN